MVVFFGTFCQSVGWRWSKIQFQCIQFQGYANKHIHPMYTQNKINVTSTQFFRWYSIPFCISTILLGRTFCAHCLLWSITIIITNKYTLSYWTNIKSDSCSLLIILYSIIIYIDWERSPVGAFTWQLYEVDGICVRAK